jgi:hypothetical protein
MVKKKIPARAGQAPRPRKNGTGEVVKYVRMPEVMADAVVAYQRREMLSTDAGAIRDILKRFLQAEGLL